MEKKKPIGILSSGRLFCLFALAGFLILFLNYLTRELWFDEVLTLQFASLESPQQIYNTYTIPNNQIIHTIFIHLFLRAGAIPEYLRLFPLLCGALMLWLIWKNFAKTGKLPLLCALTALVISPPFLLYASALRGYMLAALFCVCALCAGRKYIYTGKISALAGWFAASLGAVGVMPSALAGIAAAGLYLVPCCGKKFWRNKKLYFLASTPIIAFALFYLPIRSDLQNAFALKEGWHHGGYALLALATAGIVTFFIPLTAAVFYHRPSLRFWPRTLIWFLPLGGLILPVSPFPRVWFVLFPFFALLAAGYLRRMPEKFLRIAIAAALVWGILTSLEFSRKMLSPAVSLAGQDDFYAPVFATSGFTPSATAGFIRQTVGKQPVTVFASFDSDPFALIYYQPLMMDVPPGKVKSLPGNSLIILRAGEDPAVYAERFQGILTEIHRNELHTVYRFTRRTLFLPGS